MLNLLIVLAASSAQAAEAPPAAPAQKTEGDRMICQKVEETGSRLGGKRVCMTKLQWELQRKQMREVVEAQQQRRN